MRMPRKPVKNHAVFLVEGGEIVKCKGCGEDFPNIGELSKHKKVCPASTAAPNQDGFFIPLALCPEEIHLYAVGKTLGLHVRGELTPDGVSIQEVALIR